VDAPRDRTLDLSPCEGNAPPAELCGPGMFVHTIEGRQISIRSGANHARQSLRFKKGRGPGVKLTGVTLLSRQNPGETPRVRSAAAGGRAREAW